jgi:nucleotidyltransferase/DNA polymerase involved in DNA repair
VQVTSIDEAYLQFLLPATMIQQVTNAFEKHVQARRLHAYDIMILKSQYGNLNGAANALAEKLRADIFAATSCTASVVNSMCDLFKCFP